jgi:hypothetical protein
MKPQVNEKLLRDDILKGALESRQGDLSAAAFGLDTASPLQ